MSVTSMLNGKSPVDKKFREALKSAVPGKKAVKTISKVECFSNDYVLLAPNELDNGYKSSVAGAAFDYMARFMIARIVKAQRWKSFCNLTAYGGLLYLKPDLKHKEFAVLEEYYVNGLSYVMEYIYSKADAIDNIFDKNPAYVELNAYKEFVHNSSAYNYEYKLDMKKLIGYAVFFAKLEIMYRSKVKPDDIQSVMNIEAGLSDDILKMCNVFEAKFIRANLITEKSDVVYNPAFGLMSMLVHGADADIYIDNVLYDFKTTKNNKYVWGEFGQVLAYYILNDLADENDINADLRFRKIERLALYKARYGETEYIDISDIPYEVLKESEKVIKNIIM